MRYLGERLHERGWAVSGPALPGHTTTPEEMADSTFDEWYAAVEHAFDELAARCDAVAVVGQSLGGLLALHLAAQRGDELAAVASLAAPIWLPRLSRAVGGLYARIPQLDGWVPMIPKVAGSDVRDPAMRRSNPSYRVIPARALAQLDRAMKVVRAELTRVRVPTLVLHGRQDHTVPYACSEAIARGVSAAIVRHRPLHGSYHLIAIDIERDLVAQEVGRFFADRFAERGAVAEPAAGERATLRR
jgi:carboxylesterase